MKALFAAAIVMVASTCPVSAQFFSNGNNGQTKPSAGFAADALRSSVEQMQKETEKDPPKSQSSQDDKEAEMRAYREETRKHLETVRQQQEGGLPAVKPTPATPPLNSAAAAAAAAGGRGIGSGMQVPAPAQPQQQPQQRPQQQQQADVYLPPSNDPPTNYTPQQQAFAKRIHNISDADLRAAVFREMQLTGQPQNIPNINDKDLNLRRFQLKVLSDEANLRLKERRSSGGDASQLEDTATRANNRFKRVSNEAVRRGFNPNTFGSAAIGAFGAAGGVGAATAGAAALGPRPERFTTGPGVGTPTNPYGQPIPSHANGGEMQVIQSSGSLHGLSGAGSALEQYNNSAHSPYPGWNPSASQNPDRPSANYEQQRQQWAQQRQQYKQRSGSGNPDSFRF